LVLLEEQDRSRRDRAQIAEGCERIERGLLLANNEPEKRYLARRLAEMRGRIGNAQDT
jgi:predicted RNA polymerase sigma factor